MHIASSSPALTLAHPGNREKVASLRCTVQWGSGLMGPMAGPTPQTHMSPVGAGCPARIGCGRLVQLDVSIACQHPVGGQQVTLPGAASLLAPPQLSSAQPDLRGRVKDVWAWRLGDAACTLWPRHIDASPCTSVSSSAKSRWQRTSPARWTTEGHSATVSSMVTASMAQLYAEN